MRTPSGAGSAKVQLRLKRTNVALLAGFALCVLTVVCVYALVRQKLVVTVDAQGVFWPMGGVSRVSPPRAGTVERVLAREGDAVKERQPLVVIRHRLVPTEEVKAMQIREQMLKERLDQVQVAIEKKEKHMGGEESTALIRLEDELSAALVQLRDKVNTLREESSTVLYAPRSGYLAELRAVAGAEVHQDQALATITTKSPEYRVRAYVPSGLATRLARGAQAQVRLSAGPDSAGQIIGRIISVSTLPVSPRDVDRSVLIQEPLYEIEIALDPARKPALGRDRQISPGMPVGIGFEVDHRTLLECMVGRFASP